MSDDQRTPAEVRAAERMERARVHIAAARKAIADKRATAANDTSEATP